MAKQLGSVNESLRHLVGLVMRSKLPATVVLTLVAVLSFGAAAHADPVEEGKAPAPSLALSSNTPVAGTAGSVATAPTATAVTAPTAGSLATAPTATVVTAPSEATVASTVAGAPSEPPTVASTVAGAPSVPPTTAYDLGKTALDTKDFGTAVAQFRLAIVADPGNADAHNFLAFSSRKNGDLTTAFAEYKVALKLNPKHRGAHEYLGEYYVQVGKVSLAKTELAKLKVICGVGCEQYLDLAKTIASTKKK